MFLIEDSNGRFGKFKSSGKLIFTPDIREAVAFNSEKEAWDLLKKRYKKNAQNNFKVVREDLYKSDFKTVDIVESSELVRTKVPFSIAQMKEQLYDTITEQIDAKFEEVHNYEKMLSDIHHFLIESSVELTEHQSQLAMKKIQQILRDRCESKKELQRLKILRAETAKAVENAEAFIYFEYQNKIIDDVETFLFAED